MYERPDVIESRTHKIETTCGTMYLTLGFDNNKLVEVRPILGKVGNCARALLEPFGVVLSLLLQTETSRDNIVKALSSHLDINCSNPIKYKGDQYHSCSDVIAKKIIEELLNRGEIKLEEET